MAIDGVVYLYVVLIMIVFGVIISSLYYYLFYYRHRLSSSSSQQQQQQQQKQTGQQTITKQYQSLHEDNVDPNIKEVSIYPDDDLHLQQSTIISNLLKNRKAAAESSTKPNPL